MPRHKKGTLVCVIPKYGSYDWRWNHTKDLVEEGGWLYTVQGFRPQSHRQNDTGRDQYVLKSVATGAIMVAYPDEITTNLKVLDKVDPSRMKEQDDDEATAHNTSNPYQLSIL